jgi:Holliday junction DNA helicase RuvB
MAALRPTSFDSYLGQPAVIATLRSSIAAAKAGGWQLDHVLLGGPAGTGKTSLSAVIAAELGGALKTTSAPSIEHAGQLAALLSALSPGDVLFIDEIHRLPIGIAEILYSAMEDGKIDLFAGKRPITIKLPRFTLIGATTASGMLPRPLLDRFGFVFQLQPYGTEDLEQILVANARRIGLPIDAGGAQEIARRSRGTPRIANRLLRRVRDKAFGLIDRAVAASALDELGLDGLGLDATDRAYLAIVGDQGPIGLEALATQLGCERVTVEEQIEPYLVQQKLVTRTARGRMATATGLRHAGIAPRLKAA